MGAVLCGAFIVVVYARRGGHAEQQQQQQQLADTHGVRITSTCRAWIAGRRFLSSARARQCFASDNSEPFCSGDGGCGGESETGIDNKRQPVASTPKSPFVRTHHEIHTRPAPDDQTCEQTQRGKKTNREENENEMAGIK